LHTTLIALISLTENTLLQVT